MLILELLMVAIVWFGVARMTTPPWKGRATNALKLYLTVRMVWVLLAWPIDQEGSVVPAWQLILDVIDQIDGTTFWTFAAIGAAVRFTGVLASMWRWQLVLRGQEIELPFRHILGAFLIGRAIGFFLPSTAGLDAYKLYDASRFSGRTVEVTAGTLLEKVLGVSGIFLTFLVALPFGISIFGDNAGTVAAITLPMATAIIAGLLTLLWFPGLAQWFVERLPLPGKERLEGVVLRISRATAAYRNKKGLVLLLLFCSLAVHFTTASMYYFMAIAVGAGEAAKFWEIVFGSAIQIFATVIGPTIGGLGVREAAQALTVGSIIGVGPAIVSATLGFWVGEVPTLFGFFYWLVRGDDYRPSYCIVEGHQVDYAEASRAATALETEEERAARAARGVGDAPPYSARARRAAAYGLGAGIWAGILLGIGEAIAIGFQGFGTEAQVLWYGPFAYAVLFGGLCLLGGLVLAAFPMDDADTRGWTPSLALLFTVVPIGLAVTLFRLRRDVYAEQMPPLDVLLMVLGGFGLLALGLFFLGPKIFRGGLGTLLRPVVALPILALVMLGGWLGMRLAPTVPVVRTTPAAASAALADRPNIILIMVDTLRADHLSCYGGEWVETPNLCRVATDGGTVFEGFAHSSWTKPSTATLLTSLIPSSHQTMSKPSALPEEITTVAESLQAHGYATGAFVSNTNLTESFGFAQGFDEYHYLGPDYLFGAAESSSKLVLYQIARRVYFMFVPGKRFGDFYQDSQVVNRNAFEWLDRHEDARFFLFLHYMDVHDPYFAHPYDGTGFDRASNQHPSLSQAEEMHRLYNGEIAYLDGEFGNLISKLEAQDLWDDSVVVLVSDHGEEFGEHGGFWHGLTLYDEQIHIPMLVKWPKGERLAEPEVRDTPARLIDVAPTLLRRAGARIPDEMQGLDLAGDLASRSERDRMVFAEEDHEGNVLRAIRTSHWKWIEANEGNPRGLPTEELFHIADDPGETVNLSEREPGTAAELAQHAAAQALAAEKVGTASEADVSCDEYAGLVALGYVEPGGRPDCE